jgi:hypothetical protein
MSPTLNKLYFLATDRRKGTERSDRPALSNPTKYNSIPEIQKRTTEHRLGLHITFLLLFTLGYTQQNYNFTKTGSRRRGNGGFFFRKTFLSQKEYKPMSALHDTTRHDTTRQYLLTFWSSSFVEQIFKNSFSVSQPTQVFLVTVTNQLVQ